MRASSGLISAITVCWAYWPLSARLPGPVSLTRPPAASDEYMALAFSALSAMLPAPGRSFWYFMATALATTSASFSLDSKSDNRTLDLAVTGGRRFPFNVFAYDRLWRIVLKNSAVEAEGIR